MKSFGKGIFWIGFILLMGVALAYLIIMLADVTAFAVRSVMLTICVIILISGLLMLMGRAYERRGERKEAVRREADFNSRLAAEKQPTPQPDTKE